MNGQQSDRGNTSHHGLIETALQQYLETNGTISVTQFQEVLNAQNAKLPGGIRDIQTYLMHCPQFTIIEGQIVLSHTMFEQQTQQQQPEQQNWQRQQNNNNINNNSTQSRGRAGDNRQRGRGAGRTSGDSSGGVSRSSRKKSNPKVQEQKSDNGFKQDTAGVLRLGKQVEELKGQMLSMKDEIKALQAQLNESQWNNFHLSTAMGKLQTEVERLRAIVDKRGARSKPQQRIAPPSFFNPPKDHPQARNDSKEVVMNSVEKQIVEVPKQESKQVQQKQAMEDRKEDVDKAKKRRKSGKGSRGSKNESGEGDERNNNKSGGEQSGRSRSRGNGRGGRGRGRGRGQNGGGGALDNNTTSKSIQPVALQ
eukprot:TRINITY_DN3258_c0_g2_i5.p2 TRINITY_DN3258_c0_g2~~TRINITY_DN3258_c0_g2_i5.p2  ORF type:complete len:365 (-),score=51.05 TRINITY_DN3258_c0_g2_i5:755-1849(-)